MSLTLSAVTYTYDRVPPEVVALSGVDLVVEPGELILVVGTTGSGKSTLLRIAGGLLEPSTGSALIDGEPLTRDAVGSRVGLVFQDAESQLFADTVLDDVAFGPTNLGASREVAVAQARRALEAVGLDPDEFGSRSPFALSGGEARRAAVAGVVAMQPRYLLADEPTAGLDAPGRAAVIELVLAARATAGVVVVSHTSDEFLAHADRVLILRDGMSAWWGAGPDLVADPTPLVSAGLAVPDVLRVQVALRERCGYDEELSLDPRAVARSIAHFKGWTT